MNRAEHLIATILANPNSTDNEALANKLLREFHSGFPVEYLRPLLLSHDERVVGTASFIADELGSKASPLLDTVAKLLSYPNRFVRGDAIASILTCTTGKNRNEIAAVILLLNDPDWPIRWKTMEFLSLASLDQLHGGLSCFMDREPGSEHTERLRWLTSDCGRKPDETASWLQSNDPLDRKYGVIAATRMASITIKPLAEASSIEDDDVSQFANSMLRMRERAGLSERE